MNGPNSEICAFYSLTGNNTRHMCTNERCFFCSALLENVPVHLYSDMTDELDLEVLLNTFIKKIQIV